MKSSGRMRTWRSIILAAGIGLLAASCQVEDLQRLGRRYWLWNFDSEAAGEIPTGWSVAETASTGAPAKWEIVEDTSAPSKPQAVAVTQTKNRGRTYNLLIAEDTRYRDVGLRVMVKAGTGQEDQGGGPIWRAQDADNYYIARWNPLENNFRVYYVKGGRRKQIGSADVDVDPEQWHEIAIEHRDTTIKASLDGRLLIEVETDVFTDAGMIGLWTKADAVTSFDDVSVAEIE